MKRSVLGVVVGYLLWSALWLGGNALFFSEAAGLVEAGERVTDTADLTALLVLSVACSVVAGYATARLARERIRMTVVIMGALLVFTGVVVQVNAWSLMPVWYHLTFLVLLIPAAVVGGLAAEFQS